MAVIKRVNATNPDAVSWSIDLSGGIQRWLSSTAAVLTGNAKARMIAWNLPDPIRCNREPILRHGPITRQISDAADARSVPGYRI